MKLWQMTYTGKRFFPDQPDPDVVDIRDIAHHLALTNRYGGATRVPYSVAEHSVLLSYAMDEVDPSVSFQALLHDAGEAYIADIPRPLKDATPDDRMHDLERQWQQVVYNKFRVPVTEQSTKLVKELDTRITLDEVHWLMEHPQSYDDVFGDMKPLQVPIGAWNWRTAEQRFLKAFERLR